VLPGMQLVWSTHVEMNFMSSLAQDMTCRDAFRVLAVMGGLWSTHVEIHLVFSLEWVGLVNIC